jgi:DNA-binding transcriptional LysR family regulator
MHLEILKVFCDVVELGSFSAAASHNFVTQSAVSQQVRTLEDRYGRRLLERGRGVIRPTDAGRVFYEASKEIVNRFRDMEGRLQKLTNVITGSVRVLTVHTVGLYEMSGAVRRFLRAYPHVNLRIEYRRSSRIYEEVQKGDADIGVVAYPMRRPQLALIPFREDRLVLICPPNHPLAHYQSISIKKLAGQDFVGFERDLPTRRQTDRILRRNGIEVRYKMELDNIETIKRVVEIGTGCALLPEPAVRQEVRNRSIAAVQIRDETLLRPVGIIHRRGQHLSPATEKFIEYLCATT